MPTAKLTTAPHILIGDLGTDLGLTAEDLASCLRTNVRTLERWHETDTYPQTQARGKLGELEALHEHLRQTFSTGEARRDWLRRPSPYLGELSPVDAIRAGRVDRVEAALQALEQGIHA